MVIFAAIRFRRCLSTSAALSGKHNFRKFPVFNKRGTMIEKRQKFERGEHTNRGVRLPGVEPPDQPFRYVAELEPQLIVPADLDACDLKPYVSYRAPDVVQSEFTAEDLFEAVYRRKIVDDFKAGKLDADGAPLEPSAEERLTAEEAYLNARRTGSDIF